MGTGLAERRNPLEVDTADIGEVVFVHSQRALLTMFELLYGEPVSSNLIFEDFAEIASYSALYDLLPVIAPKLRALLMQMPGLWEDVRQDYLFHLTLARMLRCEEIFNDALRHFIGIGHDFAELNTHLDFSMEFAFKVAQLQQKQTRVIAKLTTDIQALTLPTYTRLRIPGPQLAATSEYNAFESKRMNPQGQDYLPSIARHIFSLWLNNQLSGNTPWPYPPSQLSLRAACEYATHATQISNELALFDPSAPLDFLTAHLQRQNPVETPNARSVMAVEDELKKLVNQLSVLALPFIAAPDFQPAFRQLVWAGKTLPHRHFPPTAVIPGSHGHGGDLPTDPPGGLLYRPSGVRVGGLHGVERIGDADKRRLIKFERYGGTAMSDCKAHYFTCVDLSEVKMPWGEDFGRSCEVRGMEPASEEWLRILGLLKK